MPTPHDDIRILDEWKKKARAYLDRGYGKTRAYEKIAGVYRTYRPTVHYWLDENYRKWRINYDRAVRLAGNISSRNRARMSIYKIAGIITGTWNGFMNSEIERRAKVSGSAVKRYQALAGLKPNPSRYGIKPKLSECDDINVLIAYNHGIRRATLAEDFGVSISSISNIIKNGKKKGLVKLKGVQRPRERIRFNEAVGVYLEIKSPYRRGRFVKAYFQPAAQEIAKSLELGVPKRIVEAIALCELCNYFKEHPIDYGLAGKAPLYDRHYKTKAMRHVSTLAGRRAKKIKMLTDMVGAPVKIKVRGGDTEYLPRLTRFERKLFKAMRELPDAPSPRVLGMLQEYLDPENLKSLRDVGDEKCITRQRVWEIVWEETSPWFKEPYRRRLIREMAEQLSMY